MADRNSILDLLCDSQALKEVIANELWNATSPAAAFAYRADTTSGLTWGYYGGVLFNGTTRTAIGSGTKTLTASATNYIDVDESGTVTVQTTGYTANTVYKVTTDAAGITDWVDCRTLRLDKLRPLNTQTGASYTLVIADAKRTVETNNASANTLTVPPNSAVPMPLNVRIPIRQYGAGQTTISPGAGVTLRSYSTGFKTAGQYAEAYIEQRAVDEWIVIGAVV